MDSKQFKALIKTGHYLTVEDMGNGQHRLDLKGRVKGGGFWGATAGFYVGQFAVHLVEQTICFGTAGVVGLFCPPMFAPVLATMEKVALPVTTVVANSVAIGCGVVGGVTTGPI